MDSREIDKLVAEKVMGYTGDKANATHNFPIDIKAAFEVVEKIRSLTRNDQCFVMAFDQEKWVVGFTEFLEIKFDYQASHGLLPMAICLCALKAKGVDVV